MEGKGEAAGDEAAGREGRVDASRPNNEEVIGELVKDLEASAIPQEEGGGGDREEEETQGASSDQEDPDGAACQEEEPDTNDDKPSLADDTVDEDAMKDVEGSMTDEDKEKNKDMAQQLKHDGNEAFRKGDFFESIRLYTLALRTCPLSYDKERAILYANRAAAKLSLGFKEPAIEDCTLAVKRNPGYLKALLRRAKLYEETEKLDEALEDYKAVLLIDPLHREAVYAARRLPEQINERNEKMKAEMMDKLKDLGNMVLRPFGLSTSNFKLQQDPNTGGYSVSFQQNNS